MNDLYQCATLEDIKQWLVDIEAKQAGLLAEFLKLQNYKNAVEWNQLVLVCEAMTMHGWENFVGQTPVEAYCGKGLSGSWETSLMNANWQKMPNSWRDWSKSGDSFVVYQGADTKNYGVTKLNSQRNELPVNPFKIGRFIANCQLSVAPFVAEVTSLRASLDAQMQPRQYGGDFYYVNINTNFSAHDWPGHASVQSQYFHDEQDVPADEDNYWVVPHIEFGKLSARRNRLCWKVDLNYTKQWGELPLKTQKQSLADDLVLIFAELETRLNKKKLQYNMQLAKQHANAIIQAWLSSTADAIYYENIQAEIDESAKQTQSLWG